MEKRPAINALISRANKMNKTFMTYSRPPIFIVGNPRSGTTLLRLMLTCHPRIGIPPEGGWLVQMYPKYHNVLIDQTNIEGIVSELLLTPKVEEWKLDYSILMDDLENNMPEDYSSFARRIYAHYISRSGKVRWGDKNNYYLYHIKTIARIFPDAVFLHIVRDGRDVACSYRDLRNVKGEYAPMLPSSACIAAYDWTKNIRQIQSGIQAVGLQHAYTIRYEELVQQSENTLKEICGFLGEDYDERMLAFAEQNRANKLEPDTYMAWKSLTRDPVTESRVGRWRHEMFDEDRLAFAILSNSVLRQYIYETENIKPRISSLIFIIYLLLRICEHRGQILFRKVVNKVRRAR